MSTVAESFRAAVKHHQQGSSVQATKLARDILRVDPGHAGSLTLLGVTAFTQDRPDEALQYLMQAVAIDPSDPQLCFNLGCVQERLNQLAQAVASFEKTVQLKPDFLEAHLNLGRVLQAAGRPIDAVDVYRNSLRLHPGSPEIYRSLGRLLWVLDEQDGAVACFRSALVLTPDDVEAHCHLGTVLRSRGELEEAVKVIQKAVLLKPDDSQIACLQGKILVDAGLTDEAVSAFSKAIEKDSQSADAYYRLGLLLKDREEFGAARNCLESTIEIDPNHVSARTALGMVLMLQGDSEASLAIMHGAIERHPASAEAQRGLGHAMKELKRHNEAVAAYQTSLQIEPDSAVTRYMLAKTLHLISDHDEAIRQFEEAIKLLPDSAQIHFHYAKTLVSVGRFEEAIKAFQSSLKWNPECWRSHFDLGNTYNSCTDFESARRCYEEALRLQPDDPGILISLGNVLKSLDNLGGAAIAYRKVLRQLPEKTRWELWIATLCPAVFESNESIDEYRRDLHNHLERISDTGVSFGLEEITNAACPVPYQLQFHGRDDRPLKEAYAQIFQQGLPQIQPRVNLGKPRVGFVVTAGHEGVFLRFLGGVLQGLNPDLFDVVVVCSSMGEKRIQNQFPKVGLQTLVIPSRFDQMVDTIRDAAFDVLYYWEVGSDVNNYFLPFFRLAPVQCTSGGVPVTSGTPCLDYFLSSDIVEGANADTHYSETLVRANSLLTCQSRLTLPTAPKTREQFGFTSDQHIYLCPHKIEKFHPDLDTLFQGILQNDPQGRIVIPADKQGYIANKLLGRMNRQMPDVIDRVVLLPHQSLDDYLSLTAAADVLLDPIYYGGGLTAYDGFSMNKAIVTLPTQFVRGRYTTGFYQKMGVTDLIASTPEEYVDLAVRLGSDPAWRESIESRIRETSGILFDNSDAVRDHEQLFLAMIAEARREGSNEILTSRGTQS
jgi:protein O-GlcNAc transferase